MWKLMTGMRRKAGISPEDFRHYYEAVHAPLAAGVLGDAARAYARNYVAEKRFVFPDRPAPPPSSMPGFDCIAEVWFETRAELDQVLAAMTRPEAKASLVTDRGRFIDESSICYMICEELRSSS